MGAVPVFYPIWYTTADFARVQPICMYHREQEPDPDDPVGIRNYHVLARARIEVDAAGAMCAGVLEDEVPHPPAQLEEAARPRTLLRITADDCYKLYVNGVFVAEGPAPAYPEHYYFNTIDITFYLHGGANVLAVHLYYQGLLNRVWNSRDGRMGVAADVLALDARGAVASCSEPVWHYRVTQAFGLGSTVGYDTQFLEDFDARLWDEDWAGEGFDDSAWQPMVKAAWADYALEPQPTKMLEHRELEPVAVTTAPAAHANPSSTGSPSTTVLRADFGREVVGALMLRAIGCTGATVTIRVGEELNPDGSVRYDMRCNCRYEETWTLSEHGGYDRPRPCTLEQFDYKAFRYVELLVPAGVQLRTQDIRVRERCYPLDESLCTLETSDRWLGPIFTMCKRAVRLNTQDAYLDCPSREKGQYLGDAVVVGAAQMWLSGSTEMMDKAIDQFAQTAELVDSGLMSDAPGSFMQEIADYSLMYGLMVWNRYRMTGDRAALAARYKTVRGVLDHFERFARADGLLEQVDDKWNLVDWPENLRDGYDFPLTRPRVAPGCHNVINALYVGACRTLAQIEGMLGLPCTRDWRRLRTAFQRAFFRPGQDGRGLFVDAEGSEHASLHANLYPLYFGLCPAEAEQGIADFLVEKGLCCGVLLSYFYLKALARVGRYEDVYATLVNETEHGWVNMLREGATTCWEAWGADQKWNTSLCHAWACAPIPVLIEDIAGLVPDPTAPEGFRFEPHVPEALERFELTVPFRGVRYRVTRTDSAGGGADGARLTLVKEGTYPQ